MLEFSRYIYENYPHLKEKIHYWQLLSLLDKNEDKIIIVRENDKIKGGAMFVRVSDETLWKIEWGFLDLAKPYDIKQVLDDNGKNIHFLYLVSDNFKTIRKGLREVIKKENPDTVSWFNPEMTGLNKFKIKRGELCQSLL